MRKILLALWLLLLATGVLAQAAQGISPVDVSKMQQVTAVDLSADGEALAFTRRVPANPFQENKPASYHLFLYDMEAEREIPFFTSYSVSHAQFRPQHQSVTFLARAEGDEVRSLYEMPLSGGEARKLYAFTTSIADYEWSQDGAQLAFIAPEPKDEATESPLPYEPVIYEENLTYARAYLIKLGETTGEPERLQLEGDVHRLAWSPSGERLAVAAAPTPLVDDYYMKQRVHIVDASTRKVTGEVEHRAKLGAFAFSPDGERLAMIAGADIHDPIAGRLFVVDATGGAPTNLQPEFPGMFESIQWVDDQTIQFLASEGVHATLGAIEADGGNLRRNMAGESGDPVITSFDRADNGAMAMVAETPQHPGEAYFLDAGAQAPERLTDSNPWLKDRQMGRQEVITYEARDGQEIQGLLIHPVNEEEGKRYPLITVVHGGPEAHYDNGWLTRYSVPGQMAAIEGYAVFYPNYRGSTGRGVDFAMSSQGDLAGKEFDDIVDGVDYLIERGLVDEERVGVTGGSYGGYATGWMATRYTDRFAAGVMFVGISDNISKWGTSDIPEELYLVHARKRIWEDYDFFLKRSPIYYAGQAKTPLLIMAGAEDTRVDPSQSMELYRHIKTRTDTPVRLVFYPGEGHGNRNASARFDYSQRLMGWFNQYLKKEEARP